MRSPAHPILIPTFLALRDTVPSSAECVKQLTKSKECRCNTFDHSAWACCFCKMELNRRGVEEGLLNRSGAELVACFDLVG